MNFTAGSSLLHCTLAMLAFILISLQPAAVAADLDIDQLMQSLSKAKSGRANFVERKHLAMLERPVESSGELRYTAPDHLEKRTFKPKPESIVVDGNSLVVERGTKKYALQLQDYPELAGFIDSVRGTLSGDRKALERTYQLTLEGRTERWTLLLTPLDAKMSAIVKLVRIVGSREAVLSIEVLQTDGDRSLMTIEALASQ